MPLGEQGGWPLTMFLKPDGSPFWGGTYFPKETRYGRPGFKYVLGEIARIWRDERGTERRQCQGAPRCAAKTGRSCAAGTLSPRLLAEAGHALLQAVDMVRGGLKGAPKFPQASVFDLLWRLHEKDGGQSFGNAVTVTLLNICQGGIYDHLAGGFARYSVDDRWLVPHFEKMLYDNAQLISLLARVWRLGKNGLFRVRLEETIAWLLAEMIAAESMFASSYDADSEGEEGRYYVWSADEMRSALPPDRLELFSSVYGISTQGNWEGHNILNRLADLALRAADEEAALAACRRRLLRDPPAAPETNLRRQGAGRLERPGDWRACRSCAYLRASGLAARRRQSLSLAAGHALAGWQTASFVAQRPTPPSGDSRRLCQADRRRLASLCRFRRPDVSR